MKNPVKRPCRWVQLYCFCSNVRAGWSGAIDIVPDQPARDISDQNVGWKVLLT